MMSVLVPCYGDLHLLERSVPQLLASTGVQLEVILVNNDTTQAEALRRLVTSWDDGRVRVLELEHAAGFARALNAGIAASSGELVFFANSDLFVSGTYLDELVKFFAARPSAGCATGKILGYDLGRDGGTSVIDTTGIVMGRDRGASDRGQNRPDDGLYEKEGQVFGCSGAAFAVRRKALDSVVIAGEYLDETFFMYKEDVDLSWRLRLAGWECWYVPRAIAYHARTSAEPAGVGSFHRNERSKPRHVRVHSLKNQWLLLVKNEDRANLLRDLPFIALREIMVLAYNAFTAPGITIEAVRGFTRTLPEARRKRRIVKSSQRVSPTEMRGWFQRRSQSTTVLFGRRDERLPIHPR
jgi:GT2 family glycosyltransferase